MLNRDEEEEDAEEVRWGYGGGYEGTVKTGNLNAAHSLSMNVRVRIPFQHAPRQTRVSPRTPNPMYDGNSGNVTERGAVAAATTIPDEDEFC